MLLLLRLPRRNHGSLEELIQATSAKSPLQVALGRVHASGSQKPNCRLLRRSRLFCSDPQPPNLGLNIEAVSKSVDCFLFHPTVIACHKPQSSTNRISAFFKAKIRSQPSIHP